MSAVVYADSESDGWPPVDRPTPKPRLSFQVVEDAMWEWAATHDQAPTMVQLRAELNKAGVDRTYELGQFLKDIGYGSLRSNFERIKPRVWAWR